VNAGANDGSRTCDLLITNRLIPKNSKIHNKPQQSNPVKSIHSPFYLIVSCCHLLPHFADKWSKNGALIYTVTHKEKGLRRANVNKPQISLTPTVK